MTIVSNSVLNCPERNAECEEIAREIFHLLDMNKDGALDDEDLRSAELGTNGDAMTKLASAIIERYQVGWAVVRIIQIS